MLTRVSPAARAAGYWSSVAAAGFSLAYVIGQLAEWLGWLGSAGGPRSSSTPLGIAVLLPPSLLLGPAFVLAMIGLHEATPRARQVWSHAAVAFSTAYFVMIGITYYVQLTWIAPRLAAARVAGMEPFLFVPFDSFLYAVDILGYSLMSVATLFAAAALGREARTARRLLAANGLLLPFIALQMYWHDLIWIAALWAVTFPASMWSLARFFRGADLLLDHRAVAAADDAPAAVEAAAARTVG